VIIIIIIVMDKNEMKIKIINNKNKMDTRTIGPKTKKVRYFKTPLCRNFVRKGKKYSGPKDGIDANDMGS
jgi:hypothetical protein